MHYRAHGTLPFDYRRNRSPKEPEKRRAEIGRDVDTFEMVSRALNGRIKRVAVTLVAQYTRDESPGQEILTRNKDPFQNDFAASIRLPCVDNLRSNVTLCLSGSSNGHHIWGDVKQGMGF
jgi:hypothetical protein